MNSPPWNLFRWCRACRCCFRRLHAARHEPHRLQEMQLRPSFIGRAFEANLTGCKIMHLLPSLLQVAKTRHSLAARRRICFPPRISKRCTPLSSPAARLQDDAMLSEFYRQVYERKIHRLQDNALASESPAGHQNTTLTGCQTMMLLPASYIK